MRDIDKFCRYCMKNRVRSESGGYIVCDCLCAVKEWEIGLRIQSLKKELSICTKELSELKKENSKLNNSREKDEQ